MSLFSFIVVNFVAIILLVSSTVPGRTEPQSHRFFQLFMGLSLLIAALHIADVLK